MAWRFDQALPRHPVRLHEWNLRIRMNTGHQASHTYAAARQMNEANLSASLSYRVAMRRKCFSRAKKRSTMLRFLYWAQSTGRGDFRLDNCGITGVAPSDSTRATIALESYPLSAVTEAIWPSDLQSTSSSRASACVQSCTWPPVRMKPVRLPRPSTAA
jgi:hypothetical protein